MRPPPADALLRRVEMRVARRLDGMLQGERRGRRPGPGLEPALTRRYAPGDDVRWVDWPLSARLGEPTVRVPEIDPVLTAWAVVDRSPSMDFGTVPQMKAALAEEVLAGIGVVLRRRGDRMGIVATGAAGADLVRPPAADRRGLAAGIAAVRGLPPAPEGAGTGGLVPALTGLGRLARHRGAVFVISDLPADDALEGALGALGRRHEVVVIEVRDRRERELPAVGPVTLRDVETGRRLTVDTSDPRFRERFARVVREAEEERAAMLRRAGARHVVVQTGSDWVLPLARTLTARAPVGTGGGA
jgi:uncharacterized protein (DUF58 family)